MLAGFPLVMGLYLQYCGDSISLSSSQDNVSGFPVYDRIHASIYGASGLLDYRLKADRLILRSDLGSFVIQPEVYIDSLQNIDFQSGQLSAHSQALQICSRSAYLSSSALEFSKDVSVKVVPAKSSSSHEGLFARYIHANDLSYTIADRFFIAKGKVHYCQGVQEIFADKISGHIDQDDYVFSQGKIVYRKFPQCK